MAGRKKPRPLRGTQTRRRRRRFRFNWKAALLYGSANVLMLALIVGFLAFAIRSDNVWHWIVALFIVGMGLEIARAKLQAR